MKSLIKVAALVLLTLAPTAAFADAWDKANAFLRAETGVADFTLDKTEFGNNEFVRVIHLTTEFIVGFKNGYVLVYNPADPGHPAVFSDAGPGYSEPTQTEEMREQCGRAGSFEVQIVGTNPKNMYWCTPAHLVGKSGGLTFISDAVPAVARECKITVNKVKHGHSC